MKTTAVLIVLSALTLWGAPSAEARDIIGMYADPEGTINEIFVEPYETFEVYVLLKAPSSPGGIIAWDLCIAYPDAAAGGNVVVTDWSIAGGGTNMAAPPEFQTAMLHAPPLPNDDVVLLLEISHRERYPAEGRVLSDLKESVEYWRQYVSE